MSIIAQLDALRAEFPECRVLAFADLSTRTALCASQRDAMPQEQIDALCQVGAELLNDDMAAQVATLFGGNDDQNVRRAIVITPDDMRLFLRSDQEHVDALCCICTPKINVAQFSEAAASQLCQLSVAS